MNPMYYVINFGNQGNWKYCQDNIESYKERYHVIYDTGYFVILTNYKPRKKIVYTWLFVEV